MSHWMLCCLDKWAEKPAFGTPLQEHLKRSGREIALPIEACVMLLLETGMKEEVRAPSGPACRRLYCVDPLVVFPHFETLHIRHCE